MLEVRHQPRRVRLLFVLLVALLVAGLSHQAWLEAQRASLGQDGGKGLRMPASGPATQAGPRTGGPDDALQFWLMGERSEDGAIPADGLARAMAQTEAMRKAAAQSANLAGISRGSWTWRGPGDVGGRVRSIAISPVAPDTMFVGAVAGGIWKTRDAGSSWIPVNDYLSDLAISSIVFNPAAPNTMFAGTGEGFYNLDGIRGIGILRSTDAGTTWSQVASGADLLWVNRLAMSADGATLLAGTRTGLLRSTDGGQSFIKVLTPSTQPGPTSTTEDDITDVKFLAGSSSAAVASGFGRNVYYSPNGGATWTDSAGLTFTNSRVRAELAVPASAPTTVYLVTDDANGTFWRSTDSGASFTQQSVPAHLAGQGWFANTIWVDPTDANAIIVGGQNLFRSLTGPSGPWTKISSYQAVPASAHGDQQFIVASPGYNGTTNRTVFFATGGGIYRTTDAYGTPTDVGGGLMSIHFDKLNQNLGITQFYYAGGHTGTGRILGGTQDNNALLYAPGPSGPNGWAPETGGDSGASFIDPTDPNYLYSEYLFLQIHRATNGTGPGSYIYGAKPDFSACKPAPYCLDDAWMGHANFIAPVVMDPNNVNRILAGGWSLWRTNDAKAALTTTTGPQWAAIKAPITGNVPVSAIAIAPGNSDVIYVGYGNGDVYGTTNGTAATPIWTKLDDNPGPLPARFVDSIAVDPSNANVAYVGYGGFATPNLWKTTNAGAAWTSAVGSGGTGLPVVPIRWVTAHPTHANWIYVGTETGLFASEDGGATWGIPGDSPSNVPVFNLSWMGTTLIAATHGRGLYTSETSTTQLTLSPARLNFGATKNGYLGDLVNVTPAQDVTVGFSSGSYAWTAAGDQPWIQVTNGSGTGAGKFTVSIVNPGNYIYAATELYGSITVSAPTAPIATGPSVGAATPIPVRLTINQTPATSAAAFGRVDTPAQNAAGLQGAIGLTGWALDDLGVNNVKIYRNCLAFDNPASCQMVLGNNVVFVGNAGFVPGARPDVENAFPTYPQPYRAGWGIQILSNMLPHIPNMQLYGGQGSITLYAVATDQEGRLTLLGRTSADHTPTTVTLNNDAIAKPFGTLDTPQQGATVSGTIANFGWALTPDTDMTAGNGDILIPTNGSTMTVFVDGVSKGTVAYNQCRGNVGNPVPAGVYCNDDVANIFGNATPQPPLTPRSSNPTKYRNLDQQRGVIGAFNINTTLLANGVHTIAWSVSDSAARADGIGSRFFTVLNGGALAGAADPLAAAAIRVGDAASIAGLRESASGVYGRTGFDLMASYRPIAADRGGVRSVRLPSTGRLELLLGGRVEAGYLVVKDDLRPLPIGSHLDSASGTFTWNPPVGYFGTYRLVFVGDQSKVVVDVEIK